MDNVNALTLRQSLGKVLKSLQKSGKPILIEKDRKPAAVLISLRDYQTRFVDQEADAARKDIVRALREAQLTWKAPDTAEKAIRGLRLG